MTDLGFGSFFPDFTFTLSADFKTNLLYAGICVLFTLIAFLNLKHNPKFHYQGMSSNLGFISLFALLLFIFATIYFGFKAWFSAPLDGYMDYFVFSGFLLAIALIFAANLILKHIFSYKMSIHDYLVNGIPIPFFLMGTVYSLDKGFSAIPAEIINGIILVFAAAFFLLLYLITQHE
jgi:type IV secretory pathway VirB2 component (pilin)